MKQTERKELMNCLERIAETYHLNKINAEVKEGKLIREYGYFLNKRGTYLAYTMLKKTR